MKTYNLLFENVDSYYKTDIYSCLKYKMGSNPISKSNIVYKVAFRPDIHLYKKTKHTVFKEIPIAHWLWDSFIEHIPKNNNTCMIASSSKYADETLSLSNKLGYDNDLNRYDYNTICVIGCDNLTQIIDTIKEKEHHININLYSITTPQLKNLNNFSNIYTYHFNWFDKLETLIDPSIHNNINVLDLTEMITNIIYNMTTQRHTYEYIKEQIESVYGYKLLSNTYVNAKTKLSICCDNGHEYKTTWSNFLQKRRCPVCGNIKQRLSYEHVKSYIEDNDFNLISKNYKCNNIVLKMLCPENHPCEITFGNFQGGQRCSKCSGIKKLTYDYIKKEIENSGYSLLSNTYVNAHNHLSIKCDKGHEYKVTWNNFQNGRRCPICDGGKTSDAEREIQFFVAEHVDNVICNDRTQILNKLTGNYLELDVWMPDQNKAIEYNGTYWHSFKNTVERDKFKKEQCKMLGIDLLIVNEDDYIHNKQTELNKIKQFIGK